MCAHPVIQKAAVREALLRWYDQHARRLPWRISPQARDGGLRPDPYRIWLSEIMLQQTTTGHAAPYFARFTQDWPTVFDLADASDADVMSAWAGLGYYARARNLLACARTVARDMAGKFPDQEAQLRALPGVGDYTAAALAAIAYDLPANVVDGNVERVMSRLFAVIEPLPSAKARLKILAGTLVGEDRPGDWAQALMDLGATICTPTSPRCGACPLAFGCLAERRGDPQTFPFKIAKAPRPRRYGVTFLARRKGQVGLVRRPPTGLLGGMLGLPTSEWAINPLDGPARQSAAPRPAVWRELLSIEHIFTHFSLSLMVVGTETSEAWSDLIWTDVDVATASLPTVFRKALTQGLGVLGEGSPCAPHKSPGDVTRR